MQMYGFWRSAAAFRVRMALNLKGIAVEETMINLDTGEQHDPAYTKLNPGASLPSLFDGDGPPLYQSIAILEYLEEKYPSPPLLPADLRARARVRALALIWAADHHPLIVPRVRAYLVKTLHADKDQETAWIQHWFREGLTIGESRLAGDPATGAFCHGDTPTIADLCLMSQAVGAKVFGVDTAPFPTINRIVANCMAKDEIARAHPLRQPGAPAAH